MLVLVSLDERRTEVVTQDNVDVPGDIVAGSARSFFAAGDFQGGLLAIVGTTEQALAGTLTQSGDGVGRVWPFVVGLLVAGLAVTVVGVIIGNRRRRARSVQRTREAQIDGDLRRLEPSGEELPICRTTRLPLRRHPRSTRARRCGPSTPCNVTNRHRTTTRCERSGPAAA